MFQLLREYALWKEEYGTTSEKLVFICAAVHTSVD